MSICAKIKYQAYKNRASFCYTVTNAPQLQKFKLILKHSSEKADWSFLAVERLSEQKPYSDW